MDLFAPVRTLFDLIDGWGPGLTRDLLDAIRANPWTGVPLVVAFVICVAWFVWLAVWPESSRCSVVEQPPAAPGLSSERKRLDAVVHLGDQRRIS